MDVKSGKINVIIDGQFGSTGKGLISSYVAVNNHVDIFVSNLSPNAGHTFDVGDGPKVVKQIPVGLVIHRRSQGYLSAGSIIEPIQLLKEIERFDIDPERICIHPHAAVIDPDDINSERDDNSSVSKIASTQSGTGVALANKILRKARLAKDIPELQHMVKTLDLVELLNLKLNILMETSQGLGLGINSGFYPYTTSREISVSQCLSDIQVPPKYIGNVMISIRTYPIRVGNIVKDGKIIGTSGPFYDDSKELSWEELGQKPELTTVTKRVRRVATFSIKQYNQAIKTINPTHIFLNFCNYIKSKEVKNILSKLRPKPTHIGLGPSVFEVNKIHRNEYNGVLDNLLQH